MRRRAGFSLLEILISAALLAVIGLAVAGAVTQSAKEARTTSDYSLSLFLSQKVVEELIQSTYENPHAETVLRALDGTRMDVEDPFNPYFATLEDIARPYGQMEVGPDLGVDARAVSLHRLYRDFNLTISSTATPVPELPGAPQILEQLQVLYQWPGLKAEERLYNFPLLLAKSHVSPVAEPLIAQDLPGMDAAARKVLYGSAPGPQDLATFASSVGGSPSAVRDTGSILVVTMYAMNDAAALASAISTMEASLPGGSPGGPDDPQRRVDVARLYEKRAAAAWQCLLYTKDPAARTSTSLTAADLGGRSLVNGAFLFFTISKAIRMRATFDYDTARALEHYLAARRQLAPLATRPYWQYTLERKILELAKLRVMYAEIDDVTFVNQWLDALLSLYRGRNRAVTEFLMREKPACTGLVGIQNLHPIIRDRISEMKAAETSLSQVQARVLSEFF